MSDTGFNEIADLAMRKSGQAFRATHRYVVEARLSAILLRENFLSLEELSDCLKARPNPQFEDEVVSALTSKETRFFDDRDTLSHIVDTMLPKMGADRAETAIDRPVRILCAGGGTGQEAYSLAILLDEAKADGKTLPPVEIISLDICKASRRRAKAGLFGHFEIQMGMSVHRMLKYFTRQDDRWQINEHIRKMVDFQTGNLLEPITELGGFDVILCRNVLTGMVGTMAAGVARSLSRTLNKEGVLFLASREILPDGVKTLRPAFDGPNAWRFGDPEEGASHGATVA